MTGPLSIVEFRSWLIEGGYTPRSASSYSGAIKNKLSDFALERAISDKPLIEYHSLADLREVTCQVREHDEFLEFNKTGNYMYSSAMKLYDLYVNERTQHESVEDILEVSRDDKIEVTTRKALIAARIGQGRFRSDLIDKWNGCALTHYPQHSMLVASHIKPWRRATNKERLDVFNGLLLLPTFDKAFDRNFISFDSAGKILISNQLQEPERLDINEGLTIRLEKQHQPYIEYHRAECFIG